MDSRLPMQNMSKAAMLCGLQTVLFRDFRTSITTKAFYLSKAIIDS